MPATGGLPAEKVTASYNDLGQAKGLTSDLGGQSVHVKDTLYTGTGKLSQGSYGALGHIARQLTWDPATDRLTNVTTLTKADTASPVKVQDDDFYYDAGDNVVRVADKTAIVDGQLGVQSECFSYDSGNITSVDTGGQKGDYAYPATGNAVTSITYPDRTDGYGYNDAGQMTSRTGAAATTSPPPNAVSSARRRTRGPD